MKKQKKILKDVGLKINLNTDEEINEKETIVKEQLPKSGIKIYEDTNIFVEI